MKLPRFSPGILVLAIVLVVIVGVSAASPLWFPAAKQRVQAWLKNRAANPASASGHEGQDHAGHDHAGHDDATALELTEKALKNIGFEPLTVKLGDFEKTISLPAMVVERPGKSQIQITAPLGGIVTAIHTVDGVAVEPGTALFDIRLTHEELVTSQRDFLKTAESLEVVNREIARLESIVGLIAGKDILAQKYERQKLEASLLAERQGLLLHGLSDPQVDEILKTKKLLQTLSVLAPSHEHAHEHCREEHLFHIQELNVKLGQHVDAGALLGIVADHCELYIEGTAFEDDAERLRQALHAGQEISAVLLSGQKRIEAVQGLKLLYLADHVDPDTRAFKFYLPLSNAVVLDRTTENGRRYLQWRYRPGQRLELRVPVDRVEKQIVLPSEAVVDDGAENYVFRQAGNHFDRVAVHVRDRDGDRVAVANDGTLFEGDVLAAKGAYQMHLALKNKSGGGIDPHAGHNH